MDDQNETQAEPQGESQSSTDSTETQQSNLSTPTPEGETPKEPKVVMPSEPPPLAVKSLPSYKCHKTVQAAKIARVDRAPSMESPETATVGMFKLTFEDEGIDPAYVDGDFVHKHAPSPGHYFVVYEDGYKSISPAEAFEAGYTLI